ncbi:CIA30 family protein, partial [Candidatus Pelagibacter sp.]|nr:CIA30 family protein [Candidatus Pelagibacter sp.]
MKKIIFLLLVLFFQNYTFSKEMILDQLKKPKITNQSQKWNFITDQVMGGVSTGKFEVEEVDGVLCYRMTGDVSTKNNGGFIQFRTKLIPEINSNNYNGIFI